VIGHSVRVLAPVRSAFLDTLRCVVAAIGSEAVAARWDDATVVPPYLVGQLLGHMYNAAAATERYLDAEPPVAPPAPPALYFAREPSAEHAAAVNAGIRDRAARVSERGAAALTLDAAALHERLSARLATESDERVVAVMGDIILTLDGYLQSRIVELIVHLDDLAVTLGTDFQPPEAAIAIAVSYLVDVCRVRNGDLAVLRALSRRERDGVDALRAL
jgi:hypothetical protein